METRDIEAALGSYVGSVDAWAEIVGKLIKQLLRDVEVLRDRVYELEAKVSWND